MGLLLTGAGRHAVAAAAAYQGPGDVIATGWIGWYGVRAFKASTRGTACCRIMKTIGGAQTDINTDATTGIIDHAAIASHLAGGGGEFLKFYDQTGNGHTVDVATSGATATAISQNVIGSIPSASYGNLRSVANGANYPQPLTLVGVGQQADADGQSQLFTCPIQLAFSLGGASDTAFIYAGATDAVRAATDDTPHAIIGVANGLAGVIRVDGAETTSVNTGSGFTIADYDAFDFPGLGAGLQNAFEAGVIDHGINSTERSNLAANMMTFYGIT